MENGYDMFKINASIITALHERIEELFNTNAELKIKYRHLLVASQYMNQLIAVIKKNPNLQDEWIHFLSVTGLDEPSWKNEYVVDRFEIS